MLSLPESHLRGLCDFKGCISVLVKTVSKQVILAQTITAMIYGCYLYNYVYIYGGI